MCVTVKPSGHLEVYIASKSLRMNWGLDITEMWSSSSFQLLSELS